jgi:DNA-binding MarR family transcriptional regulator
MKAEDVSKLLGACYEAKRIVELMPKLPQGMRPSHIHIVDIICQLHHANGLVRISDIGLTLHITKPSITKLVNELVELKVVEKVHSKEDKRVFTVNLTPLGKKYHKKYLEAYHREVAKRLSKISEDEIRETARVIHEAYRILADENADM